MALCHMTGQLCTCSAPMLCLAPVQREPTHKITYTDGSVQELDVAVILNPDGFFRAIDRNNYDVDCDHTGYFSNSPTGYGRTPLDAIVDLLDTMDGHTTPNSSLDK